ncbi:transposable element Tcb2 transposase [Trichonephila clavipes]|nr:transposable element Tcb2 transposase [Trichonephila clavipes]
MSTMSQRSHLTNSEAWRVVGRLEGGQTQAEVAQAIGVSQMLTARRHRNMNATLLQQHLRSATGTTVSTQTVRNRLHGVGLYARRLLVCVRLTSRHRCDRREWATEHVNWRRNECSNVLFSDESRFSVHPDNRSIFILRDHGSRNNVAFVHESVRFGGGGVLVYGGISIDGRTDSTLFEMDLTARRYRDEILRPIVIPYAAAIGDDFILMDDNCWPHRANLVGISFRGRNRTNGMASVFSRHESNRARLGRSRETSCWPPTTPQTLQELERALLEEWDRIPQLVINSLIDSMPQRTAMAGSDVVQSRRPNFDDFFQHLWPYIGNNTANVVFQMVNRLRLIRIDQ